jgi:cobalt-zinc-cadmium resistance protein CzcA
MIDAIVRSALNNRLMVLVAVVGLAIGGYLSLKQLPVDAFPDATPALVQIFTVSEGLATEDVET